jgi:CPA2 family monovalent cation:H+ antiporter-2
VIVAPTSSAAGRTLSDVNLRGLTGATVLCIFRPSANEQRTLVPTGHERLRAGDVLALAGSQDAIAAARDLLA